MATADVNFNFGVRRKIAPLGPATRYVWGAMLCGFVLTCLVVRSETPARLRASLSDRLRTQPATTTTTTAAAVTADKAQLPEWIEPHRPQAAQRPDWCRKLIASPRARPYKPLFGECGRKHNAVLCADGRPAFFGWKNEDLYTWNRHFRHLKRTGVFLDVAANDPVSRSNTFFYEECLGWRGVCFEANPTYFSLLRRRRTCALVKRCMSNRRHKVVFADHGGTGGVLATNKNAAWAKFTNTRTIECIQTARALAALGETHIDFMSLDVEGHELFVLQGIDWSATSINVIVTENTSRQLAEFLALRGFQLHLVQKSNTFDALRGDRLFVHKRVTWGKPV